MGSDLDWHDYVEPEIDGPEVNCVYKCPKCGHREVIPESGDMACPPSVLCPKCKNRMYQDTES